MSQPIYAIFLFHFLRRIEKKDARSLVCVQNSFVIIRACVRYLKSGVPINLKILFMGAKCLVLKIRGSQASTAPTLTHPL